MRIALFCLLVVGVVGIVGLQTGEAKPVGKVQICHVNKANKPGVLAYHYRATGTEAVYVPYYGLYYWRPFRIDQDRVVTYHVGRTVSVDAADAADHLAHGDATNFADLTEAALLNLSSLESRQDYQGVWDRWPRFGQYRITHDSEKLANAVVKNGNCYFSAVVVVDN